MGSSVGFAVIVSLYISIGIMAAAGSVCLSKKFLGARGEQLFFGLFLVPIAAFYLAFAAYFGDVHAWRLETAAVIVFAVLGLVGVRLPFVLMLGYLVHGVWDAAHELDALGASSLFEPGRAATLPLGYGFFCATYDVLMVAYFYTRRRQWTSAEGP